MKVFEELKKEKDLWNIEGKYSNINYNSEFITCLVSSFNDDDLRSAMQNLIKYDSMRPILIIEPALQNFSMIIRDPNFKTYLALELYYSKLFDKNISIKND